jgi:hypothetical protein
MCLGLASSGCKCQWESCASVSRTEEQSGVGEAVAAASPEDQPQSTSSDYAGGHAVGDAGAEAAPEGINPQEVFLPVVLAVARAFPEYSADVVTACLAATSATVPQTNVRAMVRTAIAAEQSLALRLQQMIAMAVLADPSGWTAYLFVCEEIRRILGRPL